ncbi:hypothetical protein SCA6_000968 [Theobroma cacao]
MSIMIRPRCLALLSSMKHISFRLLVKHSLQDYFKKGFSWKLQRLVPAIGANKLVWKDNKMGMSLLIQVFLQSSFSLKEVNILENLERSFVFHHGAKWFNFTSAGLIDGSFQMFGILSSMRHISFRLLVKHFLQYHPKKEARASNRSKQTGLEDAKMGMLLLPLSMLVITWHIDHMSD